jgi:hypothetical protein
MMCVCGHPATGHYRVAGTVIVWNPPDDTTGTHCGELGCRCTIVHRVDDGQLAGQTNVYDAINESELS